MAKGASRYPGTELELFAGALNWKTYLAQQMAEWIKGEVLEVGAGIGGNIAVFWNESVTGWTALEPDSGQAAIIGAKQRDGRLPSRCTVVAGTVSDLHPGARFGTILYIDVLEHIADDRAELSRAAEHLAPDGHLIVLSPAHQCLFSPFDTAIGHHRRYGRTTIAAAAPAGCQTVTMRMLDSAGLMLSLGNRFIMRTGMPNQWQIALWDKRFVPVSRWLDRLMGYRVGKSLLAVWRHEAGSAA